MVFALCGFPMNMEGVSFTTYTPPSPGFFWRNEGGEPIFKDMHVGFTLGRLSKGDLVVGFSEFVDNNPDITVGPEHVESENHGKVISGKRSLEFTDEWNSAEKFTRINPFSVKEEGLTWKFGQTSIFLETSKNFLRVHVSQGTKSVTHLVWHITGKLFLQDWAQYYAAQSGCFKVGDTIVLVLPQETHGAQLMLITIKMGEKND